MSENRERCAAMEVAERLESGRKEIEEAEAGIARAREELAEAEKRADWHKEDAEARRDKVLKDINEAKKLAE